MGHSPPREPFTNEEVEMIRSACTFYPDGACRMGRENAQRLRAFVEVLLHTGLRIGDAVTLRRDSILDGKMRVKTAKTGTEIYCPLPPSLIKTRSDSRHVAGIFLLDRNIEAEKCRRRLAARVEEVVSFGRNSQRSRAQISAHLCEDFVDGRGSTRSGGDPDGTSQFRNNTKALCRLGERAAGAVGGGRQASLGPEGAAQE